MALILGYKGVMPKISKGVFVAETAVISGNVEIGESCGIWYSVVIRGDVSTVKIGKNTNIQDGTVVHVTRPFHKANKTGAEGGATVIGDNVTIGHGAIIHACQIHDNAFIGMGSIIMDLAVVEKNAMVAAGSLVSPGKIIKSGELWAGVPAKFLRKLTDEEIEYIGISAHNYAELAAEYKAEENIIKK